MFDLILFMSATVGLTLIITEGKIAQQFRDSVKDKVYKVPLALRYITLGILPKEIHANDITGCNQCCGFYAGAFCGLLTILPYCLVINKLLLFGFAGSYIAVLGSTIIDYYNALLYMEQDK